MFWFRFKIPDNEDGTVVTYSSGWCGTRDRCAQNEKGILYHDKERWGIGQAEGDYIPDDVEVLTKEEVVGVIKSQAGIGGVWGMNGVGIDPADFTIEFDDNGLVFTHKDYDPSKSLVQAWPEDVFCSQKLADRYLPKAEIGTPLEDVNMVAVAEDATTLAVVSTRFVSCPTCHKTFAIIKKYENNSISLFSLDTGKTMIQGLIAKSLNITCPSGHKVALNG